MEKVNWREVNKQWAYGVTCQVRIPKVGCVVTTLLQGDTPITDFDSAVAFLENHKWRVMPYDNTADHHTRGVPVCPACWAHLSNTPTVFREFKPLRSSDVPEQ